MSRSHCNTCDIEFSSKDLSECPMCALQKELKELRRKEGLFDVAIMYIPDEDWLYDRIETLESDKKQLREILEILTQQCENCGFFTEIAVRGNPYNDEVQENKSLCEKARNTLEKTNEY